MKINSLLFALLLSGSVSFIAIAANSAHFDEKLQDYKKDLQNASSAPEKFRIRNNMRRVLREVKESNPGSFHANYQDYMTEAGVNV